MENSFQFDPHTPPSLLALEKWIATITTKPLEKLGPFNLPIYDQQTEGEIEENLSASAHLSAAQSIAIYNQQYWFRFLTLAQENFPTLVRLFGYADFNRLIAEPSILKYPPDTWAMSSAMIHLPRWIEEQYEGEDQNFILQIAQMDAAYHNLLYAPSLSACRPNQSIALQPFVYFLEMEGNLIAFRNKLLTQEPEYWLNHEFPPIDFSKKYFFALYPKKGNFLEEEISETEYKYLKILKENSADQLPLEWFQKWAQKDWIGSSLKEEACLLFEER